MDLSRFPLDGEQVTASLFRHLWVRDGLERGPEGVIVPETVLIHGRTPVAWLLTGADGAIKRRHDRNLDMNTVVSKFLDGEPSATTAPRRRGDLVAELIRPGRAGDEDGGSPFVVEYLDADALRALRTARLPRRAVLQRFTEPAGRCNHVIRATWAPRLLLAEKRVNLTKLYAGGGRAGGREHEEGTPDADEAARRAAAAGLGSVFQRGVTFDGAPHSTELEPVRGRVLPEALQELCETIAYHIAQVTNLKVRLSRLVVDCKLGSDGRLWLLRAVSARVEGPKPGALLASAVTGEGSASGGGASGGAHSRSGRPSTGSSASSGAEIRRRARARQLEQRGKRATSQAPSTVNQASTMGLSRPRSTLGALDTTRAADPSVPLARSADLAGGIRPLTAPGLQPRGGRLALGAPIGPDELVDSILGTAAAEGVRAAGEQAAASGAPGWLVQSAARTGIKARHARWHTWLETGRTKSRHADQGETEPGRLPTVGSSRTNAADIDQKASTRARRAGAQSPVPWDQPDDDHVRIASTKGRATAETSTLLAPRHRLERVRPAGSVSTSQVSGVIQPLRQGQCPSCGASGASRDRRVPYKTLMAHYAALLQHLGLEPLAARDVPSLQGVHVIAAAQRVGDDLVPAHGRAWPADHSGQLPGGVLATAGGVGLYGVSVARAIAADYDVAVAAAEAAAGVSPSQGVSRAAAAASAVGPVPPTISVLHPTLSASDYASAYRDDSMFQFKTAAVCEGCFLVLSRMAEAMLVGEPPGRALVSIMGERARRAWAKRVHARQPGAGSPARHRPATSPYGVSRELSAPSVAPLQDGKGTPLRMKHMRERRQRQASTASAAIRSSGVEPDDAALEALGTVKASARPPRSSRGLRRHRDKATAGLYDSLGLGLAGRDAPGLAGAEDDEHAIASHIRSASDRARPSTVGMPGGGARGRRGGKHLSRSTVLAADKIGRADPGAYAHVRSSRMGGSGPQWAERGAQDEDDAGDDAAVLAREWSRLSSGTPAELFGSPHGAPPFASRMASPLSRAGAAAGGMLSPSSARHAVEGLTAESGRIKIPMSGGTGVRAGDPRASQHRGHPLVHLQDAAVPSTVLAGTDRFPTAGLSRHLPRAARPDPGDGRMAASAGASVPSLTPSARDLASRSAKEQRRLLSAPGDDRAPWLGPPGPGSSQHTRSVLWEPDASRPATTAAVYGSRRGRASSPSRGRSSRHSGSGAHGARPSTVMTPSGPRTQLRAGSGPRRAASSLTQAGGELAPGAKEAGGGARPGTAPTFSLLMEQARESVGRTMELEGAQADALAAGRAREEVAAAKVQRALRRRAANQRTVNKLIAAESESRASRAESMRRQAGPVAGEDGYEEALAMGDVQPDDGGDDRALAGDGVAGEEGEHRSAEPSVGHGRLGLRGARPPPVLSEEEAARTRRSHALSLAASAIADVFSAGALHAPAKTFDAAERREQARDGSAESESDEERAGGAPSRPAAERKSSSSGGFGRVESPPAKSTAAFGVAVAPARVLTVEQREAKRANALLVRDEARARKRRHGDKKLGTPGDGRQKPKAHAPGADPVSLAAGLAVKAMLASESVIQAFRPALAVPDRRSGIIAVGIRRLDAGSQGRQDRERLQAAGFSGAALPSMDTVKAAVSAAAMRRGASGGEEATAVKAAHEALTRASQHPTLQILRRGVHGQYEPDARDRARAADARKRRRTGEKVRRWELDEHAAEAFVIESRDLVTGRCWLSFVREDELMQAYEDPGAVRLLKRMAAQAEGAASSLIRAPQGRFAGDAFMHAAVRRLKEWEQMPPRLAASAGAGGGAIGDMDAVGVDSELQSLRTASKRAATGTNGNAAGAAVSAGSSSEPGGSAETPKSSVPRAKSRGARSVRLQIWDSLPASAASRTGGGRLLSAVVPSGDGSFALVSVLPRQLMLQPDAGRPVGHQIARFDASVVWLSRPKSVTSAPDLVLSELVALLRSVVLDGPGAAASGKRHDVATGGEEPGRAVGKAVPGTGRLRGAAKRAITLGNAAWAASRRTAGRAAEGSMVSEGLGDAAVMEPERPRALLEPAGYDPLRVESGGLLRPAGWAADPGMRHGILGPVRLFAAKCAVSGKPSEGLAGVSRLSLPAVALQFSAARADRALGQPPTATRPLQANPWPISALAKAGPMEKRGTVATRVAIHDGSRIIRHSLRVGPSATPVLTMDSFSLDTGEAWSEPLAWADAARPEQNPFVQAAAVELLAAVEEDYGLPIGTHLGQCARLVPGRVVLGQRSPESERAVERGVLLACMVRSHLGDVHVRDDTGLGLSYLVAVRMLLPPAAGEDTSGPPAEEPSVQEALASAHAGADPSAGAPGDVSLPRFRVLVSRLTPGRAGVAAFASVAHADVSPPSRVILRRLRAFPASFKAGFLFPGSMTQGHRPETGSRFPVSCAGDALLTADAGPGVSVEASATTAWRPCLLGPGGVDMDTLWRTLPFSRVNDQRLNAALEPVEATRFRATTEEVERANRTGRDRVRQMRDDIDGYAVGSEAKAASRVMGTRARAAPGARQ